MKRDEFLKHKLTNFFHTVVLFGAMIGLLAMIGSLLGGASGLFWAGLLGGVFLLFSQSLSPQLMLRLYGARPLSIYEAPELYQIVEALSRRAGLPRLPRLYLIANPTMNAFALGQRDAAALGLTTGLLNGLNRRELTAVLAHEISHIRHNDMRVLSAAALIAQLTGLFSNFGQLLLVLNLPLLLFGATTISWLAIGLLLTAPALSALLQLALSRTREFDADLGAVRLTGDPEGLAAALAKLEYYQNGLLRRLLVPGYRMPDPILLRTHPSTRERISRLRQLVPTPQPEVFRPWNRGLGQV